MKAVLLLAAVVAVAGIITFFIDRNTPTKTHMDLSQYYGVSDGDIAVIAGADVSKTFGKNIDGKTFIDYSSVSSYVNPRIFYDASAQLLITTTPTDKITLNLADGSASSDARTVDGTLYISLDFITKYTDMESTAYTDPDRIVIKNDWDYAAADVKEDACIRYKAGIKSPIIEDVTAGQTLRVTDAASDGTASDGKISGWTHVASDSGFVGYIEDKYLGSEYEKKTDHTSPVGAYTHIEKDYKINMAFHQTTSQASNAALDTSLANVTGINTLAPTWFFLDSDDGSLTSLVSSTYVQKAHDKGYEVWAVVNDFDGKVNTNTDTKAALSSEPARVKIIGTVISDVKTAGADGVNVDFENVTEECAPYFLEFIRELSVECRNAGLVLSVDNYVPTYTEYLDRTEQAAVADYVVCMCYDEHTSGSKEAGSVASLPFVKKGIEDTLSEVPAAQTVIAIPFFTRLWTTGSSKTPESKAYGMSEAEAFVTDHNMAKYWDKDTGQNYAELQDSDAYYQIWLEDAESIAEKMKLIKDAGCAGAAEWKMGLETSDIWGVISQYLK